MAFATEGADAGFAEHQDSGAKECAPQKKLHGITSIDGCFPMLFHKTNSNYPHFSQSRIGNALIWAVVFIVPRASFKYRLLLRKVDFSGVNTLGPNHLRAMEIS
jgi:hypothetical protein